MSRWGQYCRVGFHSPDTSNFRCIFGAGQNTTYTIGLRTDKSIPQLVTVRFYKPDFAAVMAVNENGRIEGDLVIWRNVTVQPGYVKKLSVYAHVKNNVKEGELLIADAYAGGIRATDTTRVVRGEGMRVPMEIFVDDGKMYAEPDEVLNYTITVKNGFGPDRDFTLRTQLPPTLRFLDATGEFRRDNRSIKAASFSPSPPPSFLRNSKKITAIIPIININNKIVIN